MSENLGHFLQGKRVNAALSWILVAFLLVAAVAGLVRNNALWAALAFVVGGLAVLPPIAFRDPTAMLPWEVTALSAAPVIGHSFATFTLTSNLATYLSVAAIALIVAVELHLFTPVRMTDSFAVSFVVVATLATAGLWAVARWSLDKLLGTEFLLVSGVDPHVIETQLMWEFVASTAAGVVAGLLFTYYVRRRTDSDVWLPTEAKA